MSQASSLELFPIQIATLTSQALAGISLYLRDDLNDSFILYRSAEYPLTEQDLQRLRDRGYRLIYIERYAKEVYQDYLKQIAFEHDAVNTPMRVGALAEIIRGVLQEAFDTADDEHMVQSTRALAKATSKLVQAEDFTSRDLIHVLHHDYGTFTHSANVAFYAGMLASELGYSSDDIEQIVMGGLLHDLGKLEISERILCKPDKLTDTEFRVIKRHPSLGFNRLSHRSDVTFGQLMMVYQHHERADGKGYPVGITDEDLHPWAKLCSVVDVYEALTSTRPYRKAMSTETALAILKKDSGKAFNAELVSCWTSIIHSSLN